MTSAEASAVEFANADDSKDEKTEEEKAASSEGEEKSSGSLTKLNDTQAAELCSWLTTELGASRVREVKITHRLSDSPAIVTDHESGALRRMLRMVVSPVLTNLIRSCHRLMFRFL